MSAPSGCTTLFRYRAYREESLAAMSEQRPTRAAAAPYRNASALARSLALASILVAVFAFPAGAAQRWFTVEIIVFEDLRSDNLHAENWPPDPGEASLANAIELTRLPGDAPHDGVHAYRLVKSSNLMLGGVRNHLRRSAHYRPLVHAGWRLPGLPRSAARPVHVGRSLDGSEARAAEGVGAERSSVHGTVTVSLARYLQVDVDLLYHRATSSEAAVPGSVPTRFRLVSERRMRSGELHYIDHPLFGVLVLLTPG